MRIARALTTYLRLCVPRCQAEKAAGPIAEAICVAKVEPTPRWLAKLAMRHVADLSFDRLPEAEKKAERTKAATQLGRFFDERLRVQGNRAGIPSPSTVQAEIQRCIEAFKVGLRVEQGLNAFVWYVRRLDPGAASAGSALEELVARLVPHQGPGPKQHGLAELVRNHLRQRLVDATRGLRRTDPRALADKLCMALGFRLRDACGQPFDAWMKAALDVKRGGQVE